MSTKIIHISDIHLGRTASEKKNFETIINKIFERYTDDKPIIIITGDMVDDGEKEQYVEVRRILDKLCNSQFRVLLIPGNHDYGTNGNFARKEKFKRFKEYFSGYFIDRKVEFPYFPPVDQFGGHIFIGLNSMEGVFRSGEEVAPEDDGIFAGNTPNYGDKEVFFASGKLGDEQINRTLTILEKYKDRSSEQKVILYLHHHPFDIKDGLIHKFVHSLVDGKEFLQKIADYRVDLLLFGHEHIHLDFTETKWSKEYGIHRTKILCSGKSTGGERAKEGTIKNGELEETDASNKLLGRRIEITSDGDIKLKTIDLNLEC